MLQRELWFYDLATLEPQFVIAQLDGTPLRLTSFFDSAAHATTVVYGDDCGNFGALIIPEFSLRW